LRRSANLIQAFPLKTQCMFQKALMLILKTGEKKQKVNTKGQTPSTLVNIHILCAVRISTFFCTNNRHVYKNIFSSLSIFFISGPSC